MGWAGLDWIRQGQTALDQNLQAGAKLGGASGGAAGGDPCSPHSRLLLFSVFAPALALGVSRVHSLMDRLRVG